MPNIQLVDKIQKLLESISMKVLPGHAYPTFPWASCDRTFPLREILTQIPTSFFAASGRLKCEKAILSVEAITTTQYHSAGDWWALSLLSLNHPDGTATLAFLPIKSDRKDSRPFILPNSKKIAFSLITDYPNQGEVEWVAYDPIDAFHDEEIAETLLRHFWTYQGFYSCSSLSDSDDVITFATSLETTTYTLNMLDHDIIIKIHSGDVEIACGELRLHIPKVPGDLATIGQVGEEVGRIEYASGDDVITIGILYQQTQ